jgi:polysaccharide biosynthesis/export protein
MRYASLFAVLTGLLFLTSCGLNSNIMFRKPSKEGLTIIRDSIPMIPMEEYRISPNDRVSLMMMVNDGTRVIDMFAGVPQTVGGGAGGGMNQMMMRQGQGGGMGYVIRPNGFTDLPMVGEIKLAGLTIKECQDMLAEIFKEFYNNPFVQVTIVNKRVIVFPGGGGDASVVQLMNNNTTLMEVLAMVGGVPDRGRVKKVKLMRQRENGGRDLYEFDLSTIDGIKYVDMVVQGNDYIYIEPTRQLAQGITGEILPVLSVITTGILTYSFFERFIKSDEE